MNIAKGGKGEDIINPQLYDLATTAFLYDGMYGTAEANAVEKFYGNEDDDTIWAGKATVLGHHFGGGGDDTIYMGHSNAGNNYAYGNSGSDLLDATWYH